MTHPLAGIKVADFSRVLAGPLATMTLADLGASVIKVERPGLGDDTRQWGPPWTAHSSSYFECVNRSKQSVALDLSDPDDLRIAKALIAESDVMVENFLTGTLDRLGLGYDAMAALNPQLIYCSITGFGSGLGAAKPGYDFVVQAVGGLMSISGFPEGPPTKTGVALVDVLTGKDATIAVLAALHERATSGLGQHVEVNLLSSLLGSLVNQTSATLTTGTAPTRMGNKHPSIAPYETLQCGPDTLAIACGNDTQFARLAAALERPELAGDDRFATNPSRVANRPALVEALEAALAARSIVEWTALLDAAGVPAGPVNDIVAAIGLARDLGLDPTIDVGESQQVRHPITWSRSDLPAPTPPPALGQHTEDIRSRFKE